MDARVIISTLFSLGLSLVVFDGASIQAQEPKPAESPKAEAPEPDASGEAIGKSDQELLNELLGRREKAQRDLLLLGAQLAVKKAEVQRADAEVQVFRLQHPDTLDEKAFLEWVGSDPEVANLRAQIQKAVDRRDATARMTHSVSDPSLVHANRILSSYRQKLEGVIEARRKIYFQEVMGGQIHATPGEIERTLDRLIGELENLKRSLPRDARQP